MMSNPFIWNPQLSERTLSFLTKRWHQLTINFLLNLNKMWIENSGDFTFHPGRGEGQGQEAMWGVAGLEPQLESDAFHILLYQANMLPMICHCSSQGKLKKKKKKKN